MQLRSHPSRIFAAIRISSPKACAIPTHKNRSALRSSAGSRPARQRRILGGCWAIWRTNDFNKQHGFEAWGAVAGPRRDLTARLPTILFNEGNLRMTDKRPILVTGAAGQVGAVGRTVCGLLLERGLRVRAMVRREDDRSAALRTAGADVVVGD